MPWFGRCRLVITLNASIENNKPTGDTGIDINDSPSSDNLGMSLKKSYFEGSNNGKSWSSTSSIGFPSTSGENAFSLSSSLSPGRILQRLVV